MFHFDPMYLIFVGPFFLLGLFAQFKVKSTFTKYSKVRASSGVTGAQAAQQMLQTAGIRGVKIEQVNGFLSDHYDPRTHTVRLSSDVYGSTSLAALGIACHEVGHAIQHAQKYSPLVIRNAAVPMANVGSSGGVILFIIGMLLNSFGLALAGLILFAAVVAFQVINLPVEFNASSRAKEMLPAMGLVRPGPETAAISSVLGAAALTYVAGTLQSIATLAYYAYILFGRRN